ncbi:MAG: U32 family peptidase [Bacilli bacterium]|nr:U32 family peptidase [Bacilli bacterium]
MNKYYITNPNNIDRYINLDISGFIFGIKKFSSEFNNYLSLKDISLMCDKCKNNNKDIIIFLNRLYFEHEIDELKETIKELSKLDIIIGFTDDAVLNILDELGFKGEKLLISNHLGTNSYTLDFYLNKGVKNAYISTEITIDEINEINNHTGANIFIKGYGYLNMATSSRKLLTNYFKFINKNKDKNSYTFKDFVTSKDYKIVEEYNSNFYTGDIYSSLKYLDQLDNLSIILDNYMIDVEVFYKEVNNFINHNINSEGYTGFLDKKTVYKVEDYE